MPHPIRIAIHKKIEVPTKKQIKHDYRSDWKKVGVIDYSESPGIFSYLGKGEIWNDAQFAKLLLQNFSEGEYMCIFWRKGMKGFRKFIQVVCEANGFYQKKRTVE